MPCEHEERRNNDRLFAIVEQFDERYIDEVGSVDDCVENRMSDWIGKVGIEGGPDIKAESESGESDEMKGKARKEEEDWWEEGKEAMRSEVKRRDTEQKKRKHTIRTNVF